MLAEAFLSAGKNWSVYELLKNSSSVRAKFLFAKACLNIDQCDEAENILTEEINNSKSKKSSEDITTGGHAYHLLGQIK